MKSTLFGAAAHALVALIPFGAALACGSTITGLGGGGSSTPCLSTPNYSSSRTTYSYRTYSAPSFSAGDAGTIVEGVAAGLRLFGTGMDVLNDLGNAVGNVSIGPSVGGAQPDYSRIEADNAAATNENQAKAAFDQGQAQLASGNCQGAEATFQRAYDMSHDSVFYNVYAKWRDTAHDYCAGANATVAAAAVLDPVPDPYAQSSPVKGDVYTPSSPVPYELSPEAYKPAPELPAPSHYTGHFMTADDLTADDNTADNLNAQQLQQGPTVSPAGTPVGSKADAADTAVAAAEANVKKACRAGGDPSLCSRAKIYLIRLNILPSRQNMSSLPIDR